MATLIKQSLGRRKVRRCAANCYNAKGATCTCICEGVNHGKGLEISLQNSDVVVQALLSRKGVEGVQVKLPIVVHP